MVELNRWKIAIIVTFVLLLGLVAGICLMTLSDNPYKDTAIMTCEYSNNLTNIINLQSKTLKMLTGFNYTYLDKLDCELLKGG